MRRFRVAAVVGARPQFVKAAALASACRKHGFGKRLDLFWIHTGQHYDYELSEVFFKELSLPNPRYHLKVGSAPHGVQTGRMLSAIETALVREKPDLVWVLGDTNSTLAGALAAAKLQIPIAHIEAGLRSDNRLMPEEVNRVLTDRLSALLFCPTKTAVGRLAAEGLRKGVFRTGDVMADILRTRKKGGKAGPRAPYYLATIHRNVNTDDPRRLSAILRALEGLDHPVIFPLHPRTRRAIRRHPRLRSKLGARRTNVHFSRPASYAEMIRLEKGARGIVTDSGGVQKEAFLLKVPCVTLRRETEWRESVDFGLNRLCEPDTRKIMRAFAGIQRAIARRKVHHPYGDGHASERILKHSLDFLRRR